MVSPVRQSPVFRKAVPSVFAFPPLSIWIALSQSRRTFDYRTIRHYHIGVSDIIVSPCPIFSYRGVRYYRIALTDILVSGRADGGTLPYRFNWSAVRLTFAMQQTCERVAAADGRTGCGKLGLVGRLRSPVLRRQNRRPGAEKLPLHDNVSPPAPSASRFAERNVQDGRRLNFVDCQPTVFPFLSLSLKPTLSFPPCLGALPLNRAVGRTGYGRLGLVVRPATSPLASLSLDKLEADSQPSQRFTASSSCPPRSEQGAIA